MQVHHDLLHHVVCCPAAHDDLLHPVRRSNPTRRQDRRHAHPRHRLDHRRWQRPRPAPSAAAAAHLREQTGTTTETLAKLAWHITHGQLPEWASHIGPKTLIVIDEAGMADTISLAQICSWAVEQGASVRLIGDDQQLAAIGAGGVLRDIQTTHGAVQLTELMRFTDPAESAASLALRNGDVSALGFYLDNQRVHVGDLATMTSQAFDAWRADTDTGLDSIMLAPTRDIVHDLNQQARTHR
ncbi:AAA family ATPase, partial [Brooklawnia sp.]|uniref:AAA family ATPase n=1 Tax=Brooklawnia sp. TaxID=2699740 RepID=UPI00311DBBAE